MAFKAKIGSEKNNYPLCIVLPSSSLVSPDFQILGFFFFLLFFQETLSPPDSFVNYYFNVGCFHNPHFSILCSYSSCLCRALKYLITNKSAAVSFLLEKQQSSWEGLLRAVLY